MLSLTKNYIIKILKKFKIYNFIIKDYKLKPGHKVHELSGYL